MRVTSTIRACRRFVLAIAVLLALAAPDAAQEFRVDPARGPIDLALTDPALVGAIDIHSHVDPDAPGPGGQVRGIDAFEFAKLAQMRGMRGFVFKTHQDPESAGVAYLARKHAAPGLEVFSRVALNLSTGGINVATVHHLTQIKGGWARIVEMPTRDSEYGTRNETAETMPRSRPWMLFMPPNSPKSVSVSRNGELLPEVKHLIATLTKLRTVDSGGRLALATGHSSPEEHLLLAREGRSQGLNVVLTHPGDIPQLPEAAKLGALIEINAAGIIRTEQGARSAVEMVRKIGAPSLVIGTDCGQMGNPFPTDCIAMAAKALRARGVTDRELNLMLKENPARLLGLEPPAPSSPQTSAVSRN